MPGFFLDENFVAPPDARIRGENHTLVVFFMRLFGMLGGFFLYIIYTSDPATMYPLLCAFTALTAFIGPIKAELQFHMTPKHVIAVIVFLAMGVVLFLGAL